MAVLLLGLMLFPIRALALSGTQRLSFGEYGEGQEISTQYEGQGVVFNSEGGFYPEIRWDESSDENPVLAGTFGFGSAISAEFVQPGTVVPSTVGNLSMDIGYIDEPDSTELVVETTTGPETVYTDDYGFNHLSFDGNNIIGFRVDTVDEDEPEGWEIDNLEYTIPAPPPPPGPTLSGSAPTPPDNAACPSISGPVWRKVLGLYKCKEGQIGKCAVNVAFDLPDGRGLKEADGLYDLSKVDKKFLPAATLYNALGKFKILPGAPKGFQSAAQIRDKLKTVNTAYDVVEILPYLRKALDQNDFVAIFKDVEALAGLPPCIALITSW
jgi:hypothetical protein